MVMALVAPFAPEITLAMPMVYRLYPTTRRLFKQVVESLQALGLRSVFPRLVSGLMAVYITGLLLLEQRQNGKRIADW